MCRIRRPAEPAQSAAGTVGEPGDAAQQRRADVEFTDAQQAEGVAAGVGQPVGEMARRPVRPGGQLRGYGANGGGMQVAQAQQPLGRLPVAPRDRRTAGDPVEQVQCLARLQAAQGQDADTGQVGEPRPPGEQELGPAATGDQGMHLRLVGAVEDDEAAQPVEEGA